MAQSVKYIGGMVALLGGLYFAAKRGKRSRVEGAKQVPRETTPLDVSEAETVIRDAFIGLQDFAPSEETLALLMAQSALETGRWTNLRNYNFGNLVKGSAEVPYMVANDRKWRAYPTSEAGAQDWLELIERRYPEAWEAALQGNVQAFVAGLKAKGYFEEPERPYFEAVTSLYLEFLARITGVS